MKQPGQFQKSLYAQKGQGALVAIAMVVLAVLVVAGLSVSNFGSLNSQRSLASEYSLETYYCAQSGLQEALADRMVPRSNHLMLSNSENTALKPFNKQSGRCYLNPQGATSSNLLGIYRYLIVGGDSGRDAVTGNWLPTTQQPSNVIKQPFYIISQGAICRNSDTRQAIVNGISYNASTRDVQCAPGQLLDRVTLLSKVDFSRQSGDNKDKVTNFQVISDPNSIALDQPAWVPCQNVTSAMNFNTAYGCGTFPGLHHITYYVPGGSVNTVQAPFSTKSAVSSNALIRLFFDGPYDYRTAFAAPNRSISQCLSNPALCNIKLMKLSAAGTTIPPASPETIEPGGMEYVCSGPTACTYTGPTGTTTFQPGEAVPFGWTSSSQTTGGANFIFTPSTLPGLNITGSVSTGTGRTLGSIVDMQIIPSLAGSTQVVIAPTQPLANGTYQLIVGNLRDYLGNTYAGTLLSFTVTDSTTTTTGTTTCAYPQVWSACQNKCVYPKRCICAWERYELFDEQQCGYSDPGGAEGAGTICPSSLLLKCSQQGGGLIQNGGIAYP